MTQRYFSFGGGVQSMAVLVLAVQGRVQYDAFLFANVGNDSENPATVAYVEDIAKPYAAANGIELVELQKTLRNGDKDTLLGRIEKSTSEYIPVFLANGMPGTRACTSNFKIRVISRYQKQRGATADNPCIAGLGISLDEITRARTHSGIAWQRLEYPLLDLRMTRADCRRVIEQAGLPVPPKSSCWFCPFRKPDQWTQLKREQPELFDKAVGLEVLLNGRREGKGKDHVYLHKTLVPLSQAVGDQMTMDFPDDMPCDTGYCFV
jgi:hypothetical protein